MNRENPPEESHVTRKKSATKGQYTDESLSGIYQTQAVSSSLLLALCTPRCQTANLELYQNVACFLDVLKARDNRRFQTSRTS